MSTGNPDGAWTLQSIDYAVAIGTAVFGAAATALGFVLQRIRREVVGEEKSKSIQTQLTALDIAVKRIDERITEVEEDVESQIDFMKKEIGFLATRSDIVEMRASFKEQMGELKDALKDMARRIDGLIDTHRN